MQKNSLFCFIQSDFYKFLAYTTACICFVIGIENCLAWFFHEMPLVLSMVHSSPMYFNTGIGHLIFGLGIFSIIRFPAHKVFSCFLGCLVLILGLLTAAQDLFSIDLHIDELFVSDYTTKLITVDVLYPGRMSPTAYCTLIIEGAALALIGYWRRNKLVLYVALTLGSIVIGLGLTGVIGYILDLKSAYIWIESRPISLLATAAFVISGISLISCVICVAQTEQIVLGSTIAIIYGIVVVLLTTLLSQAIRKDQQAFMQEMLFQQKIFVQNQLKRTVTSFSQFAEWLAHQTISQLYTETEWKDDVKYFKEAFNLAFSVIYSETFTEERIIVLQPVYTEYLQKNDIKSKIQNLLAQCASQQKLSYSIASGSEPKSKLFLLAIPIKDDHLKKYILVAADLHALIYSTVKIWENYGFHLELILGDSMLYATHEFSISSESSKWILTTTIPFLDTRLTLRIYPSEEVISRLRHRFIPFAVLCGGYLFAFIGALFFQMYESRNKLNQDLLLAQDELKTLNRRVQTVIDSAKDSIVAVDTDLKFLFLNKEYQNLYNTVLNGIPKIGARCDDFSSIVLPDSDRSVRYLQRMVNLWKRALAGEEFSTIVPFILPNGKNIIYEAEFNLIYDENSQIIGAIKVLRNITDRLKAEEDLRRSEARFQTVVKATNEIIWDWDIVNGTIWFNNNITKLGYEYKDIHQLYEWWLNRIYPEDKEKVSSSISEFLVHQKSESWSLEYKFQRKDGTYADIFDRGCLVFDEGRKPIRMIGAMLDISERYAMEEALRISEEKFRGFVETTKQWVWVLTHDQILSYSNPAIKDMLGYEPSEVIGHEFTDFMVDGDKEKFMHAWNDAKDAKKGWYNLDLRWKHKDGFIVDFESCAQAILGKNGEFLGVQGDERDVSEQKNLERLKENLISTMNHELRTPITALKGALSLLEAKTSANRSEKENALLMICHNNCERLVQIVSDILELQKAQSQEVVIQIEPVDIIQVAKEAMKNNQYLGITDNVTITFESDLEKAFVLANREKLQIILNNLLSNAVKYSFKNGLVRVRISKIARIIRTEIIDRGPGIPIAFQKHIFEKFARADNAYTRQKGGSGLGLSIAKAIVEKLGGSISFTSKEGVGTTFYFDLAEYYDVPQEQINVT